MYSTTILKSFLWQGRRYTYFKYTILAFFSISPSGCALRALRFGRVSTDFDIRGRKRAQGETGKRELFSPSISCADSPSSEGAERAGRRKYAETGSFSLPQSAALTAPRQRARKGRDAGSMRRPGAFLSLSRLRRQLPRQRERKGRDADSEGAERTQTGFGKTWRKGVQKAGSGGDAGAQELAWGILDLQPAGDGRKKPKETHVRRQEAASPAARKCAAGLVGDILLTIRDGQEIRPCRPSRTAPSSP